MSFFGGSQEGYEAVNEDAPQSVPKQRTPEVLSELEQSRAHAEAVIRSFSAKTLSLELLVDRETSLPLYTEKDGEVLKNEENLDVLRARFDQRVGDLKDIFEKYLVAEADLQRLENQSKSH